MQNTSEMVWLKVETHQRQWLLAADVPMQQVFAERKVRGDENYDLWTAPRVQCAPQSERAVPGAKARILRLGWPQAPKAEPH